MDKLEEEKQIEENKNEIDQVLEQLEEGLKLDP